MSVRFFSGGFTLSLIHKFQMVESLGRSHLQPGRDKLLLVRLDAGRRLSAGRRGACVDETPLVQGREPTSHASVRRSGVADWLSPRMPRMTSPRLRTPSAHGMMGQAAACPYQVLKAFGPRRTLLGRVYKAQGFTPGCSRKILRGSRTMAPEKLPNWQLTSRNHSTRAVHHHGTK